MKKLSLSLDSLLVESFPAMPDDNPELAAIVAASADSVCLFTQICTCGFTACCWN